METTVPKTKPSKLSLNERSRKILVDVISYLFIALFIYTAGSKFITFENFVFVLGKSVLIGQYNHLIAWLVPTIEIIISIFLIIPKTRNSGLIASLGLMTLFTTYLIYMINSGSELGCSCGGIVSALSWKQHIWFNIIFIILAITGLKINKKG